MRKFIKIIATRCYRRTKFDSRRLSVRPSVRSFQTLSVKLHLRDGRTDGRTNTHGNNVQRDRRRHAVSTSLRLVGSNILQDLERVPVRRVSLPACMRDIPTGEFLPSPLPRERARSREGERGGMKYPPTLLYSKQSLRTYATTLIRDCVGGVAQCLGCPSLVCGLFRIFFCRTSY